MLTIGEAGLKVYKSLCTLHAAFLLKLFHSTVFFWKKKFSSKLTTNYQVHIGCSIYSEKFFFFFLNDHIGTSLGVQWLQHCTLWLQWGWVLSILGWGTKIPHALCCGPKKKKKNLKWSDWYKNEFECLYKIGDWKIMP